jgi:hypothetical protein
VNGATYRQMESGWVVGPSICGKENEAVTQRKHTLVLGHYRIVDNSICGGERVSDSEEKHQLCI